MDNYEDFVCEANDHIKFRIIKNLDEIENSEEFRPTLSHQFFGENEKISGYKGLNVQILLSSGSLTPYLTIKYDEKLSKKSIEADDLEKILLENIPSSPRSYTLFSEMLQSDGQKYFGKIMKKYTGPDDCTYQICSVIGDDLLTDAFEIYHLNLQYMLLYFIDGTSFIDIKDPDWEYHIIYKAYNDPATQKQRYDTIGYVTMYNFFCYPNKMRKRVSQIFILPPYQRKGHGEQLLRYLYETIQSDDQVKDLTVEDASEEFQGLRDFVDCSNVLGMNEFSKDLVRDADKRNEFVDLLKKRRKLSVHQCIRVYEILTLMFLNKANTVEGLKYKQMITKRLLRICGNVSDFSHGSARKQYELVLEQKKILVEREYESLEQEYSKVIEKLYRKLETI